MDKLALLAAHYEGQHQKEAIFGAMKTIGKGMWSGAKALGKGVMGKTPGQTLKNVGGVIKDTGKTLAKSPGLVAKTQAGDLALGGLAAGGAYAGVSAFDA